MKTLFRFLFLVCCFFIFQASISAQSKLGKPFIAPNDDSGENSSLIIDLMVAEAREKNERIFVIVRAGVKETNKRINSIRLNNTRQHLSLKNIELENVVFAEAENAKGEGRIEFYLGSQLRLVLLAKRNQMPNLTCCPV